MKLAKLQAATCLAMMMLLAACARSGETVPNLNYDMSGQWAFEVPVGENVTVGAMSLSAVGDGYNGTLTTNQGNNILQIQTLTLRGETIHMVVSSPQGNVVFTGILDPLRHSFHGEVVYHTGATYPMSGTRAVRAQGEASTGTGK